MNDVRSTRFELEQQIMECWNITTDLKAITEAVLDGPGLTDDQLSNMLIGLEQLYNIKFDKLFRLFEQMIKEQHQKEPPGDITFT